MKDVERRKLDKFERQDAFMADNAADFPKDSPGEKAWKKLTDIIDEIHALAAQQVSGLTTAAQSVGNKDDLIDELYQTIRSINRAANAFEDEVPGSDLKFRIPRNRSEENLLATGRAFHADAAPLVAQFVEYGLEADFRDDLDALITQIETHGTQADSGGEQRAAATGGLLDAARRGMEVSRKLDAIVRIKYQTSPQKLAAWTVASHLDRAPRRKETPVAPTPPPA